MLSDTRDSGISPDSARLLGDQENADGKSERNTSGAVWTPIDKDLAETTGCLLCVHILRLA